MNFDTLESAEKNDCAIKAVTIITGKSYSEIHHIFTRYGRRRRSPTKNFIIRLILLYLGIQTVPMLFKGKTVRTLAREIPRKGCYLVWVKDHVLVIKDGKVCDWTENGLYRVLKVDKVL